MKRLIGIISLLLLVSLVIIIACDKKSVNGDSNSKYNLICNIGTNDYSIGIEGESGALTTEYNNESTQYGYNSLGQRETITLNLNRTLTYEDTGNKYTITGLIIVNTIAQTVQWDILATGGGFGSQGETCSGP